MIKFCKDCKHAIKPKDDTLTPLLWCDMIVSYDLVYGGKTYMPCHDARTGILNTKDRWQVGNNFNPAACGPSGIYFERKE